MTELKEVSYPEEVKTREHFVKSFIEEFNIDTRKFKGKTHIICWKLNLSNIPEEEQTAVIETIQKNLEPHMKKVSMSSFFIPVSDEPTQIMILDLRTMRYVKF